MARAGLLGDRLVVYFHCGEIMLVELSSSGKSFHMDEIFHE